MTSQWYEIYAKHTCYTSCEDASAQNKEAGWLELNKIMAKLQHLSGQPLIHQDIHYGCENLLKPNILEP